MGTRYLEHKLAVPIWTMEDVKMSTGTDEFGTPYDQTEFPRKCGHFCGITCEPGAYCCDATCGVPCPDCPDESHRFIGPRPEDFCNLCPNQKHVKGSDCGGGW